MLNPIKNYFLEKLVTTRLFLLKEKNPVTNFMQEMNHVKKILIILPVRVQASQAVQVFINKMNSTFSASEISTFETSMLRKRDVNWLGIPNSAFLNNIREEKFDLLIDLNSEQDNVCTYLGALSDAPMRIHLSEGKYDKIYNLQIRTDTEAPLSTRFDTLIIYLSKLRKSTSVIN